RKPECYPNEGAAPGEPGAALPALRTSHVAEARDVARCSLAARNEHANLRPTESRPEGCTGQDVRGGVREIACEEHSSDVKPKVPLELQRCMTPYLSTNDCAARARTKKRCLARCVRRKSGRTWTETSLLLV